MSLYINKKRKKLILRLRLRLFLFKIPEAKLILLIYFKNQTGSKLSLYIYIYTILKNNCREKIINYKLLLLLLTFFAGGAIVPFNMVVALPLYIHTVCIWYVPSFQRQIFIVKYSNIFHQQKFVAKNMTRIRTIYTKFLIYIYIYIVIITIHNVCA